MKQTETKKKKKQTGTEKHREQESTREPVRKEGPQEGSQWRTPAEAEWSQRYQTPPETGEGISVREQDHLLREVGPPR